MKINRFICIKCPLSCEIEVTAKNDEIVGIKGYKCKQGKEYAINEFTNPVRIVTTTVCVADGLLPVVPVRSEHPVPRDLIKECVKQLRTVQIEAPIECGDIICQNILDTGVDIIASRNLSRK